ncbi:uncharacterized protein LOC110460570 [Mizuhopecten yessoensis]|uniref:uncharacterized protein LOC110460570 n=1 Tax=Mizuhopecten yessoensis TaxID=6573 RepID=UPI000B457515|nr:uncharacterized protein LOC110460570 [Mizuhopecten yessoensis]
MEQATIAVKNVSMSVRKAAAHFAVPKSTLGDKVSGRSDLVTSPGKAPVLPQNVEEKIVKTVITASKCCMGISCRQLFARTGALCKRLQVADAFRNGVPGKGWFRGLKKRHPELVIGKPEKLGNSRARMLNPGVVEKYFQDLGELITNMNLANKGHLIWNADETGKQFQHTPVKILSEKGTRNVVSRVSENRTNTTIMACVNGVGAKMSPIMIVKGKTSASLHGFKVEDAPEGTIRGYQESGWMSHELGERWFRDVFLGQCGPERPQLLIMDGHSSHETLGIIELAIAENIAIFCLPPHTTHALQPLEVFGPFNSAYNHACSDFLSENSLNLVNKWSFPSLFTKAWNAGLSVQNIVNGFRACGIVPFNSSAVSHASMQPSEASDAILKTTSMDNTNLPTTTRPSTSSPARDDDSSSSATVTAPPTVVSRVPALADASFPPTISSSSSFASATVTTPPSVVSRVPARAVASLPPNLSSSSSCASATVTTPPTVSVSIPVHDGCAVPFSDDPFALLDLITAGRIDIVSADGEGVANFPPMPDSAQSQCDVENVWNNAIQRIFVSPKPEREAKPVECKRYKTCHRLLTTNQILEEKREAL